MLKQVPYSRSGRKKHGFVFHKQMKVMDQDFKGMMINIVPKGTKYNDNIKKKKRKKNLDSNHKNNLNTYLSVGKHDASFYFLLKWSEQAQLAVHSLIKTENFLLCAGSAELPFYCVEIYGNFHHILGHVVFLRPYHKTIFQDKKGFCRSYQP